MTETTLAVPLVDLDSAWSTQLFGTLAAHGVTHVCVSPGSRSTALALAADASPDLAVTIHVDERSAAFFALGLARSTGRPVALVATSGTATANYLPAVLEASHGRVPLIVLTADRPPRLRGCGAAQTIDQVGLYGGAVRLAVDLPLPAGDAASLGALGALVARACATALTGPFGPVHLNVPFEEPLRAGARVPGPLPVLGTHRAEVAQATVPEASLAALAERLAAARRPLVVAGPDAARGDATAHALMAWAAASGWPLLADAGSGLRGQASAYPGATLCACADAFLAGEPGVEAPDLVVRLGASPVGKRVGTYLAGLAAPLVMVQPDPGPRLPGGQPAWTLVGDVADVARRLTPTARRVEAGWEGAWRAIEAGTRAQLATLPLSVEADAVRRAAALLPAGARLVLSNSLPIRHAETYLGPGPQGVAPLVLRGVNGIDGVTSVALGAAYGAVGPTLLVTGDLAFLHDLGGLHAARHVAEAGRTMVVLLLNNDGGGIFSQLPIAEAAASGPFERLFGTPHGLSFAPAAALFGLGYREVTTAEEAGAAVAAALGRVGVTVVELRTSREATAEAHRACMGVLGRGAGAPPPGLALAAPPSGLALSAPPSGLAATFPPAMGEGTSRLQESFPFPHGGGEGARRADGGGAGTASYKPTWHLRTAGAPGPHPTLLLHGFSGTGAAWAPVIASWTPDGPVWMPDLPGHGGSFAPDPWADWDLARAADALADWLSDHAIAPVDLVGYSLGGRLALHLALRHPWRIGRLVLVGASPGLADERAREARLASDEAWAARIETDGLGAFAAAWEAQPLFAGLRRLDGEARAAVAADRLAHDPPALAAAMRAFSPGRQPDLRDALTRLAVPTLWVAGAEDTAYAALARELARRMPDARAAIVPGCGHNVPAEAPQVLAALLTEYLSAAPRPMTTAPSLEGAERRETP